MPMPPAMRYRIAESFWSTIATYLSQRHGITNMANKRKLIPRADLQVDPIRSQTRRQTRIRALIPCADVEMWDCLFPTSNNMNNSIPNTSRKPNLSSCSCP